MEKVILNNVSELKRYAPAWGEAKQLFDFSTINAEMVLENLAKKDLNDTITVEDIYIEDCDEDVYDLTIEDIPNFALASNIFVHNSCKEARNVITTAVLPLRGKVLNVEKSSLDKMINSIAIQRIIAAFGTGFGKNFDIDKFRYEKAIILADSDFDGKHIQALLLTLFYKYMTPLITEGRVYLAIPPLYRVLYGKDGSVYLKDDKALKEWKEKNKNKIKECIIQRFKGLGEMDPEELDETVLDIKKRTLKKITIEDAQEAEETLKVCMGQDVAPRRKFIEENAYKVILQD